MIELADETTEKQTFKGKVSLFVKWDGFTFQPVGDSDRERAKHIRRDVITEIKVSQHRSSATHRHFFAMLNETMRQWPEARGVCPFQDIEAFLEAIKFEVGYFDEFQTLAGKPYRKLKSIAWEKCDQPEFVESVYNPAVAIMAGILGITRDELITNTRYL
jgi:hypothetical protein